MKRIIFMFSLLLGASVLAASPAPQVGKAVPRYLCGVLDGGFTFVQWGPNWWDFYSDGEATGTLRHLGVAEMYTRHTPTTGGELRDGTFKIVAANGDEISGTYTGSVTEVPNKPFQYSGKATLVILAGTGRFADASGTIDATFYEILDAVTFESAEVTWTLSGIVKY